MQAVINETPLPIDLYRYVDVSGRVEQFGKFSVIFYDLNQVGQNVLFTIQLVLVLWPAVYCLGSFSWLSST